MDAEIELRSANNTHLDVQVGRLEWIAKARDKIAPAERQPNRADSAPPERSAAAPDAERLPRLIKRGIGFLKDGDIAASRLLLRHAAEAGNAQAALLLGSTFDPIVLAELGVYGLTGDRAIARSWYRTAAEYGSPEASLRIERLAAQTDK